MKYEESKMKSKIVDFYFTYLSPYAFLANSRIKKALEPLEVTLQYQPIAHTGSSDGPVFSEARYEHLVEDLKLLKVQIIDEINQK